MTREGSSFKDVNRGEEGICKVESRRKAENTTDELDEYIKNQVRREIREYLIKPILKSICIASTISGIVTAVFYQSFLLSLSLFLLAALSFTATTWNKKEKEKEIDK